MYLNRETLKRSILATARHSNQFKVHILKRRLSTKILPISRQPLIPIEFSFSPKLETN